MTEYLGNNNLFRDKTKIAPTMTKNEERWLKNYAQLRDYIKEHHQLPDKKKVEFRALLNWWKYNRKLIRLGKIDDNRAKLLQELSDSRTNHR